MPNEHPEMVFLHFPLLLIGYCQSLQTSTISLQLLLPSGLLFPLKSLVVAILTLSAGKYSGRVKYRNICSYLNRHILEGNIEKGAMLTASRRIEKCKIPG